ncbi:hypothetical protein LP048_108 [Listeria phage LP-048]|uniref:Bacteriophage SP-beta YorD domain-containing protein n=2 Tax=Pecentumvirus LP048 TaxID=2560557 RepID=A0A5C2IC14_9CAUD|nr:hypothetical protein LP048_108 [Listeria phage LP-048]AHL19781.1 hypothetical protein LP048_108 [Listeria phage LP-048]QEP53106.2 hypothetical protein FK485_0106 [Listeria phage LP-039]
MAEEKFSLDGRQYVTAVLYMYPNLDPQYDFGVVSSEGKVEAFEWHVKNITKPSIAQLDQAYKDYVKSIGSPSNPPALEPEVSKEASIGKILTEKFSALEEVNANMLLENLELQASLDKTKQQNSELVVELVDRGVL